MLARVASNQGQKPIEDHPEGAVPRVGGHKRALLLFVGGAQLVKQSPVMEEAGQGLGDLLTVVINPLRPVPKIPSWGWKREWKEKYKG